MNWFEGFEKRIFAVNGVEIAARISTRDEGKHFGTRPTLLLLHGFPQTHVMWHRVAQALRNDFDLVLPDLRGYGDSSKAPGLGDHSNYSKRALAQDLVGVMDTLGVQQFGVCGHDRGGRVAHRLAVDHPERVNKLCVIDIAPTLDMYNATDFNFARAYYHWFHLIQPHPLPETMIGATPESAKAYLHAKLGGWGAGGLAQYEPQALAEYERCFCKPEAIHSACEDYRASAGIDLDHDRESRALHNTASPGSGKVQCDMHVLWGERGVVNKLFKPLALWQSQCAAQVTGQAMPAGHFIPEELPQACAEALLACFKNP
jgi:haloacetate dehalogenase